MWQENSRTHAQHAECSLNHFILDKYVCILLKLSVGDNDKYSVKSVANLWICTGRVCVCVSYVCCAKLLSVETPASHVAFMPLIIIAILQVQWTQLWQSLILHLNGARQQPVPLKHKLFPQHKRHSPGSGWRQTETNTFTFTHPLKTHMHKLYKMVKKIISLNRTILFFQLLKLVIYFLYFCVHETHLLTYSKAYNYFH